ncbi:MAG: hypothetical protein PWP27_1563 [Clostridiales bacterium]|jgi:hypothetical protein|nr:hypothetical protein [Clostridiales bacterium]MDK2933753.1 hypothetical protein [Clostridiales bacterium]
MKFLDTSLSIIITESLTGSFNTITNIVLIVIPIMVIMQFVRDLNLLDKILGIFQPVCTFLGMRKRAVFPLLIGIVFGLAFGAGIIIQSVKEDKLSKKDIYLISVFLVLCHAVIEDTFIFVAIGVNGWILLGSRIFAAIVITLLVSIFYPKSEEVAAIEDIKTIS